MASATYSPSFSSYSSGLSDATFGDMSKTMVDSSLQNLEETDEESIDDRDEDYFPGGKGSSNSRQFSVKYAPHAVVDWFRIALDKGVAKKSTVKEEALGHLLAIGWQIYYTNKGSKRELRYKSTTGRVHNSLRTACKACIDEGGAASASDFSRMPKIGKKDISRVPTVGKQKHTALIKKQKDVSERVRLPAAIQNPIKKVPQRASSSRRNPRTVLSCLIENNVVFPGDKVSYNSGNVALACGRVTREGIKCDCCSHVFTLSSFEDHAGSTKHRPAANIFLEDGRSLMDCQKQLGMTKTSGKSQQSVEVINNGSSDKLAHDQSDNACSVCYYGGELILCDQCPAAFHGSCLGFKAVPSGEWFCPSCCCGICGLGTYDNGGVSSSHPADGSFIKCVQCEQNVHIGCLKTVRMLDDDLNENVKRENWFCTKKCEDIHMGLQKLLWKQIPVGGDNLTWTLMKCTSSSERRNPEAADDEKHRKLKRALRVMHECFQPMKDPISKTDLIEDVMFSRRSEMKRLDFGGFYVVVLERENGIITVATVRVYGEEVAEIPLVGTRSRYRRQGMCGTLMKELERQLINLGVRKLTLPAVTKALNTWTGGFGFSEMTESERSEVIRYIFLRFYHTVACQKVLTKTSPASEWRLPHKRLKETCY